MQRLVKPRAQNAGQPLAARLQALAELSRLDRPIGWRLLLLPCWMGIALSRTGQAFLAQDGWLALVFLIGAIAARGAGCTYNDIVDQSIDAQVARTRTRPLPSGRISVKAAWAWLAVQIALGFMVLLMLEPSGALISLCAIPLVAAYPFMKRITYWPQAWLGLCFSWGALVAGACLGAQFLAICLVFLGCVAWVIAYDTLYALQDREDDALIGVRSTARLFGAQWRVWVMGLYALACALWLGAAWQAGASIAALAGLIALAAMAQWGLARLPDASPEQALRAFRANSLFGLAVCLCFAFDSIWKGISA